MGPASCVSVLEDGTSKPSAEIEEDEDIAVVADEDTDTDTDTESEDEDTARRITSILPATTAYISSSDGSYAPSELPAAVGLCPSSVRCAYFSWKNKTRLSAPVL